MVKILLDPNTAIKIFYTYIAVSLGSTGVNAMTPNVETAHSIVYEKVVAIEKRMERFENLVIDLIKNK